MKLNRFAWIVLCVIYLAILLLIMLLADLGTLNVPLFTQPPYDKVGHFGLYGRASFLTHRALNRQMLKILSFSFPLGPFIFSLFTIFEEILQEILPNRTFSLLDLAASFAGIIVFYWLGEVWERRKI